MNKPYIIHICNSLYVYFKQKYLVVFDCLRFQINDGIYMSILINNTFFES